MTNNRLSLTLPDGWEDTTIFTFKGPQESGVAHNLVVTVDAKIPAKQGLEEFARRQRQAVTAEMPGFEELSFLDTLIDGRYEAKELVYRFRPSDDQSVYQKQLFLLLEGKGYTFTASFSKKTLKTVGPVVDAIIASLTLSEEVE